MESREPKVETMSIRFATEEEKSKFKEHWTQKYQSYEDWEENGFILNEEGVPSKFNENEYRLVRSPEFKEWFGDWQGDAFDEGTIQQKLSYISNELKDGKVISAKNLFIDEETGEPKLYYRGDHSRKHATWQIRDHEQAEKEAEQMDGLQKGMHIVQKRHQGIFFTDYKKVAEEYGTDMFSVTLGKFNHDVEKDHESFVLLKEYILSLAQTDRLFWSKVCKYLLYESARAAVLDKEELKRRMTEQHYLSQYLTNEDIEDLADEIFYFRRRKKPEYFFEKLFKNPAVRRGLFDYFHLGIKHHPQREQFQQLIKHYQSENAVFSKVFLRPGSVAEVNGGDEDPTVYRARKDGFSYARGQISGLASDRGSREMIAFDLKNIWVVEKKPLQIPYDPEDFRNARIF